MRCANSLPAIALALAFAGAHARASTPVTIELRPSVQVKHHQVRLGDIAYLTTRDLPTLRRLMALPLGAAPRPGEPVLLEREILERWLLSRGGLTVPGDSDGNSSLRWTGATETSIEIATQELAGEVVMQAAQSALTQWLAQRSVRSEVQASPIRDLTLPAGAPVLHVRPMPSGGQPQRRMLVWVDVWVGEHFVRTLAVRFEVNAWAPVTVATDRLDSGATIDAVTLHGATESRELDLTALRPGTRVRAAQAEEPADQRLRQPLRRGDVLTDAHLEATPAVTRGNWARLLARSGEVTVESRVEVLQDGRTGQFVRVKVPGGSGEVLARVTGRGQVEVQP